MKGTEFLTEEIFTYVYNSDKKEIQKLEFEFLKEIERNQQQFVDWVLFDYKLKGKGTYCEAYLQENNDRLSNDQKAYLNECNSEYFGIYEITKLKGKEAIIKDVFTGVKATIDVTPLEEDIALYSLVLARISKKLNRIIGSNAIILPYHFKTILTGQIIEIFQTIKEREQYLTYETFLKKNTPRVLAIVERLLGYRNEEGDVTVYQSTYRIADSKKLKGQLADLVYIKYDSQDDLYHFMSDNEIIAELVVNKDILEVECNTQVDRRIVKDLLAELLGDTLQFIKDETLTIDDII